MYSTLLEPSDAVVNREETSEGVDNLLFRWVSGAGVVPSPERGVALFQSAATWAHRVVRGDRVSSSGALQRAQAASGEWFRLSGSLVDI